MQRILLSKFCIAYMLISLVQNIKSCPCSFSTDALTCYVNASQTNVDTSLCNVPTYNEIRIIYSGNVALTVKSPSVQPVMIIPSSDSDQHILQITSINTNTTLIVIKIRLSTDQISKQLFTSSSLTTATNTTLKIYVKQITNDAKDFKIFGNSNPPSSNIVDYELIFTNDTTSNGNLNLYYLTSGLPSVRRITISGNYHTFAIDGNLMFNVTTRLTLKRLQLYNEILPYFPALQEYIIVECKYNRTAKFLQSPIVYNISLEMTNNDPINSVLPNGTFALDSLRDLKSLTLNEPKLTSSVLAAIGKQNKLVTLVLSLQSYKMEDFEEWAEGTKPLVWFLTINNLPTLDILPSRFFSDFHAIQQINLAGFSSLSKQNICPFVGINIQSQLVSWIVRLTLQNPKVVDVCAYTYITAINQRSIVDVYCFPMNTKENCEAWAKQAASCDLAAYENQCAGTTENVENLNRFDYRRSYLYLFFEQKLWVNSTRTSTPTSMPLLPPTDSSLNVGAIVGAVIALVLATIILALSIVFVRRYHHNASLKAKSLTGKDKHAISSYDADHLSIATSKTSNSSRYKLQNAFYPIEKPADEIVPPLYTAPSESGRATSYNVAPEPSAPRQSVLSHATTPHIYETVDQ